MKASFILLLFTYALFLLNCDDTRPTVNFDMEYTSSVTIPSNSGINLPIDLRTPETTTNSEQQMQVNDTRKEYVREIKLENAELTIASPDGQDFDFLNEIKVYIKADGVEETLVAERSNIPEDGLTKLNLATADNDLSPYVLEESFTLRVEVVTDKTVFRDVTIDIYTVFDVRAGLAT